MTSFSEETDNIENLVSPDQKPSPEDLLKLREVLSRHPEIAHQQLGKFNITIGEGSQIYIGDNISQVWDKESIDILVKAIQTANQESKGKVYRYLQTLPYRNQPLKDLNIDADKIEKINSSLKFVYELENKGNLSEDHRVIFSTLKEKVGSLSSVNSEIDELYDGANRLLQEAREDLQAKIDSLQAEAEGALSSSSRALEETLKEKECAIEHLKLLNGFLAEIEDAQRIAKWIDSARKNLAKYFGREALGEFPEIEEQLEYDDIQYFYFSIFQFLEQISHCLKWGVLDILDDPGIPLVLKYEVYQRVFEKIKGKISKDSKLGFSESGKKIAIECIERLISQLPFYELNSRQKPKI